MLDAGNLDFLKSVLTFWGDLTEGQQKQLLDATTTVKYAQGESVRSGSCENSHAIIVKSGELRTYMLSEDGREITLFRLHPGEVCVLAATCALQNIAFDICVDAEQPSDVLLLRSDVLAELVSQNQQVELFSLRITADRFSDVMWAMEQLLFMSFDKRLAIFLLDETAKNHTDTLNYTHDRIAKYLGSAREVVSRMLKAFETQGIVELSRGCVRVINRSALTQMVS